MDFQKQIKAMADMYYDGYKKGLEAFATRIKIELYDLGNIVSKQDINKLLEELKAEIENEM